jgi:integrase
MALFKLYITHVRSRHCNHPFLFVSQKDDVAGAPYTIDSFRQAHAKMVRRIGLVPRKDFGTTPHGHRHAYAQLMSDLKVEERIIQVALHYKSPDSQQVYKEPTAAKVNAALQEASRNIAAQLPANELHTIGL